MSSGRDVYLENNAEKSIVIIDQPGEWYKFDDKMRHVSYSQILCYNAHNGDCRIKDGHYIDEYGYDFDDHFTHWTPIVFPQK